MDGARTLSCASTPPAARSEAARKAVEARWRDYVENLVLDLVFSKVFSGDRVQYVMEQVNQSLVSLTATGHQERARWQRERERAQQELENVAAAIRSGILTGPRPGRQHSQGC